MITATKEITFDCAHMLSHYNGACKNIHGHTYKLQITFGTTAERINTEIADTSCGMIVDFSIAKDFITKYVSSFFDHALILWEEGNKIEKELIGLCRKHGLKHFVMPCRTTCENMVDFIAASLQGGLRAELDNELTIEAVRLWETPTSFAEWRKDHA